jgi:hypothetical protein
MWFILNNNNDDDDDNNNNNNNNPQTKQIPRNGERNMCYVEAKYSTSDPDINIIYGSNSKVTITKSKETLHPNTYIQIQKSVILGTCSIVRNLLNYK